MTAAEMQAGGKGFGLGDRFTDQDGKEYVFVTAASAITATYVCVFDEAYSAAHLSTSNDARGDLVGVAPVAIASGSYGWLQVKGPCLAQVLASCAANVRINTTATAGALDDDGTVGSLQVEGIYLTASRAASQGSAAAILSYPIQGVTL
jgi:hypothetical protein